MSKKRLSKLQKWILIELYENFLEDKESGLWIQEIKTRYDWKSNDKDNSISATVSRTIKTLFDNGQIILLTRGAYCSVHRGLGGQIYRDYLNAYRRCKRLGAGFDVRDKEKSFVAGYVKGIKLTDKGLETAKTLMLTSSQSVKLNIKD